MRREIRDRSEADAWLAAGLVLSRIPVDQAARAAWLVAAASESGSLPPAGVVGDVGALLLGKSLELAPLSLPDARLRAAVQSYEDQVLGRLAVDPRLEAAAFAVAKLPEELRKDAVALVVAKVCERASYTGGVALPVAAVRRLAKRAGDDLSRVGFEALRAHAVAERLAVGYEELVRGARQTGSLLGEPEIFALENLTVLGSLNQRVAIEQIVQAAEELEGALPKRLRKRSPTRGQVHTQIEDESTYPIGGFSAMSNQGSLENIVTSELMYMEDNSGGPGGLCPTGGEAERSPLNEGGVDLFDMRYAEVELLYYTRDESVFIRQRKVITFALTPDLVAARFKDAGYRWQRLVITLGTLLTVTRRMIDWLTEEGLLFRVLFLQKEGGGKTPLAEEQALAGLLFREWIEKGVVEIGDADGLDAVMKDAQERARRASCLVVSVGMRDPWSGKPDNRVRRGALVLAGATPTLRLEGSGPLEHDEEGLLAWARTARELCEEGA